MKEKIFNGNELKLFAIIAMTIDHFTCVLWPGYHYEWWIILLHLIGRLTAPTMWFMVVEGYHYTQNVKAYILRLFLFALISHFAYNFAFGIPLLPFKTGIFNQTSVMWSLAWAVVLLLVHDEERCRLPVFVKFLITLGVCAITFPSDWSCIAVLAILYINENYGNLNKQIVAMMFCIFMYSVVWFLCIDKIYAFVQLGVIIVWPFMANYNGKRGKWKGMKWFFYVYYPLHLILVGLLRLSLHGNIGLIVGGK
ncbi:MAG: conjugal transfer protein TraX [Treponema sp.]|nr:conjugal transfer protein TraX [Treponema sp.]